MFWLSSVFTCIYSLGFWALTTVGHSQCTYRVRGGCTYCPPRPSMLYLSSSFLRNGRSDLVIFHGAKPPLPWPGRPAFLLIFILLYWLSSHTSPERSLVVCEGKCTVLLGIPCPGRIGEFVRERAYGPIEDMRGYITPPHLEVASFRMLKQLVANISWVQILVWRVEETYGVVGLDRKRRHHPSYSIPRILLVAGAEWNATTTQWLQAKHSKTNQSPVNMFKHLYSWPNLKKSN